MFFSNVVWDSLVFFIHLHELRVKQNLNSLIHLEVWRFSAPTPKSETRTLIYNFRKYIEELVPFEYFSR